MQAATASQAEIHAAVQRQSAEGHSNCATIPSLYPILADRFAAAHPNLVLTQDLCKVCAPSSDSVQTVLQGMGNNNNDKVEIVSLTPESLEDVVETFQVVADACGVPERGRTLCQDFYAHLALLERAVLENYDSNPRIKNLVCCCSNGSTHRLMRGTGFRI